MRSNEWAGKTVLIAVFIAVASGLWGVDAGATNRFAAWTGEKIFDGRLGPWLAEARLIDPKAQGEEARSSGKAPDAAPSSYRLILSLGEQRPKTPLPVAGEKGTLTVTRPDGGQDRVALAFTHGYLGADLMLKRLGVYEFMVEIESGGRRGTATFSHTVR